MRFSRSLLAPILLAGSVLAYGCADRAVAKVDPRQNIEQEKEIPVQINRNLDVLFVIDDSGSMDQEQASLAQNFSRFVNVLNNIEGGLPNVHIGVVSTNVGAGPYGIMGCPENGDNGALQAAGNGCSDTPGPEPFIKDLLNEDGTTRTRNYSGELADTFSCIARLGTGGCGFEQPLESMRRALNGSNPANNGFLRDDAFLAVILITDEDDCSVADSGMFNSDDSLNNEGSALGYLTSFRCFEFGVQCDPDTPRTVGARDNCEARPSSQYMAEVAGYVDFLKGLKDDPGKVIVAGIVGNPAPVSVGLDDDNRQQLQPSCTSGSGEAFPAIRLQSFLESFPNRTTTTTICNEDLSDALTVIAELLAEVIGNPCIDGDLALTDGEPECSVADVRNRGEENQEELFIGKCNGDNSNIPCYRFETNATDCADTPTQLELIIERGGQDVPADTTVVARCVAN